jgi:hypothetical protein
MLLDERLEFADDAAVPVGPGTVNIGDQVPLSVARDVGGGDSGKLSVVFQVTEAFTSGGAATVRFQVASDSVASLATDGTQSVHVASKDFALSELTLGARFVLDLPPEASAEPYELFLGVQAVVGVAALTAGKVNAFISRDIGTWKAYDAPGQA